MESIREKLKSLLINAVRKGIKTLDPQSQYAKELAEIEDVDTIIAEEIEKICNVFTRGEITRILLLATRLKMTSGQKREVIINDIKKVARSVLVRTEAESGPLKIPQSCRRIIFDIL